ncbi:permease [Kutzneria kofuensis]|uniref:permease n=1 Tax=Kutzneria kofuensis TaxID=103725 RepID=UPI0031E7A3AF
MFIVDALAMAGSMTWEILWALILGFALSAVVQAVVRRSTVVRLLGTDSPRSLTIAAGLGAASSSCSYAAVALARALFRKGANFTAAMAFEIASTNPGGGARRDPGAAAGLAVHRGRVRRRTDHDRAAGAAVPPLPA